MLIFLPIFQNFSFLKKIKTKNQHMFTGHHYWSNQQSENNNKEFNQFLACFSEEHLVSFCLSKASGLP